ncbi:ferredoxin [Candidatus Woesearchaeota archaeon]|nr:ferredoxin [Candidatus Woesearchaeota archaeon]
MKFKITFDRNTCIGAFACVAADPDRWTYADDGKVDFKDAKDEGNGIFSLIVDEADIDPHKASAEACPVYAIKIEEIPE